MLMHGLAADRTTVWPLARRLRKHNIEVKNWGYNSFRSIHKTLPFALKVFSEFAKKNHAKTVHLVGHSMGAILARYILTKHTPENFGRLLMLAPPNHGSPWARWLSPVFGWIIHPFVELADRESSFVNQLPPPSVPYKIFQADYDWIVPQKNVAVDPSDRIVHFPTIHSAILWRKDVASAAQKYLVEGI